MKNRQGFASTLFDVVLHGVLGLALCAWLFPLMHVISSSISRPGAIASGGVTLFPVGLDFTSYRVLFETGIVPRAFLNSVVYTVGRGFMTLAVLAPMAYAMSHRALWGKTFFTGFILVTMLFSAGMIPRYIVVRALKIFDSRWAMILPLMFSAYYVFLMRTNFAAVPEELKESAHLDGASDWMVFWRIVLPVSRPILSTIGLFAAVGGWNDFFSALIYLNDKTLWPLTVILRNLVLIMSMPFMHDLVDPVEGRGLIIQAQMAIIVVSIVPIVSVYPFIQKYFAKGIMLGAIKG